MTDAHSALITNDAVVLGLLAVILGFIFKTSHSNNAACQKFYKYVPALLLCYFLPSLLNTFGIVDGHSSNVYFVASRYLLPACLILLTISIDLKAILNLGPKALIMFLTGTMGIVIGGPLAILVMSAVYPEAVGGHGPDAVWRGMTTIAGSWIGGGANQASMKEMFEVGGDIFSAMVTVDVIVANLWMAVLLLMAANHKAIDAKTGADTRAIEDLKEDAFTGLAVPKDRIPKKYQREFDAKTIWKYDMPKAYRLIYTIENNEIEVFAILLEWFDHKTYEKKFKY